MKKKFYAIGSLIAVIAPTMAIVSCTDSDNPGPKDTSKVRSDKITLAQWYEDQKTVYVEYKDANEHLDSATTGTLNSEVVTAIAQFVASIPTSKSYDTLMVRIRGLFGASASKVEEAYTMEISESGYPTLNGKEVSAYESSITSAWSSKIKFDDSDRTAKTSNDFNATDVTKLTNWKGTINTEVNKVVNSWDSKHLMAWRGGMPKNLASNVNKLGSRDNLPDLEAVDFIPEVQKLFEANYLVLNQDHQSTLLTIMWYYKNTTGTAVIIPEDDVVKIHKAFVDAWNKSFTREQDDLDPETLLNGLAAVSPDLASFVSSGVPVVKENL